MRTAPTSSGRSVHLPAAVLWDMDGTLVDTEPYWMASEHDLVREFGGSWTHDDARSIVGFDLLDAAEQLRERGGVRLPATEVVERLLDGVVSRLADAVPWRPGARELLAALAGDGVPCALVTMSWRRFSDAVLAALPASTFAAVVTGDEVTHGKPHPEPYLTAARRLGVDPRHCVAIEDSPTGVASADAAGCAVVSVPNVVDVPVQPGWHRIDSLTAIGPDDLRRIALGHVGRSAEAWPPHG